MGCENSKTIENDKKCLFSPLNVGPYTIKNRVIMAAMTRMRSGESGVPNDINAKYYAERAADAGMVLTECSPISKESDAFPGATGAYNEEQQKGWKKVFEEVHKVNGKIFVQLYHGGRVGAVPVGPSPVKNRYGEKYVEPKELSIPEIKDIIKQFVAAAKLVVDAGADGIEIHAANGYLVDIFLKDVTNLRTDEYGGSIEKRCTFLLELIDAISKEIGKQKVGVKLSPVGRYNDMFDSNPKALIEYLLPELNKKKIAFVELCQADPSGSTDNGYKVSEIEQIDNMYEKAKSYLPDVLLVGNNCLDKEKAQELIKSGKIDLVSFGKFYMSNPDLVFRLKNNLEIVPPNFSKAYGGNEEGYCDFPKHESNK